MSKRVSLTFFAATALPLMTACGTYTLGIVHPQSQKTAQQQQLDTLTCKDQANLVANSAGRQTADFFLGMTIIGAPVAFEREKAKEREVFSECMTAKGYNVTPADGSAPTGPAIPSPSEAAVADQATPSQVPGADQLSIALPTGFELKPTTDTLRNDGVVFYAINRTVDVGLMVIPVRHEGITDLRAFAATRKASQVDRLKDATSSEVILLEVGGHHAARYRATGTFGKVKLTYVTTLIEGQQEIVLMNAWTGATNAIQQMPMLESLARTVSGIL
jgi:hypothetical protein